MFRLCHLIAGADAWVLFKKNGVDSGIDSPRADEFRLVFNRSARVLFLLGSMSGDEQGDVVRQWCARKRKCFDHFASPGQQDLRHNLVRSDRLGIYENLGFVFLDTNSLLLLFRGKSKCGRDDPLAEVSFTDEQRN